VRVPFTLAKIKGTGPRLIEMFRADGFLPIGALALSLYPFIITSAAAYSQSLNSALLERYLVACIYNLIFFSLMLISIRFLQPRLLRTCVSIGLWAFLGIFTFVSIYHFSLYGQLVGLPSIYAVMDITGQETREYLGTIFRYDYALWALLAVAPLSLATRYCFLGSLPQRNGFVFGLMSVGLLIALSYVGLQKTFLYTNNPIIFFVEGVEEAIIQKNEMREVNADMAIEKQTAVQNKDSEPATHILIIGEATTRRHMSFYGYNRATSPNLTKLRSELYVGQDVCSSRGTTISSLIEMLSFATHDDHSLVFKAPNLIQLMKLAGYETYWISNQQSIGFSDTWSGIFSSSADNRVFVNKRGWGEGVSLDEKLFQPFTDALSDHAAKRFIIIHLMGGHAAYELRYPSDFAKFDTTDGIDPRVLSKDKVSFVARYGPLKALFSPKSFTSQYNAYDNAMFYNDFVVSQFIKKVQGLKRVTVTYIPDHGEALGETSDFVGHIDGQAPKQVYEIPLLFYFSPDLKNELAKRLGTFKLNLTKPFQTDRIIQTLLDLYKISYPLARPNESLFSDSFEPKSRFCDSLKPSPPILTSSSNRQSLSIAR
jgi:heptose-I-phosphate ethanolaminephosphotransferase